MGKYSGLKETLDRFAQPLEFQQRVDAYKVHYADQTATEMARAFSNARSEKQRLEGEVKLMNVELEALSQLLVANLEDQQLQKIQLATGETLYIEYSPYASVEDRGAVIEWLKKKKLGAMLTINWQSYNAFIKELLISGKPTPPGTKITIKSSARLRGGNSSNSENGEN